ncbi:MAG: Amidohydrolase [Akkermansiaceae bacterium]|nr:Amidohydrolase [Akkermansiaceae bacterium]
MASAIAMSALSFLPLSLAAAALLTSAIAAPLQFELGPIQPAADGKPAESPQPGELRKPSAEVTELWHGDRLIFSARAIEGRSFSGDNPATGTWVVSALANDTSAEGKSSHATKCHGIWLITPDGKSRRISPLELDAFAPLISPDATAIAFTGSFWGDSQQKVFLCDAASGEILPASSYQENVNQFLAASLSWSPDSRTLTFQESWEKDGPHLLLRTLTLVSTSSSSHTPPLKFKLASAPDPEIAADEKTPAGIPADRPKTYEFRQPAPNVEELWLGEHRLFSAHTIEGCSFSNDDASTGVWAISAVTGDRPSMGNENLNTTTRDGRLVLDASPREIYLVSRDGKSRRISLPRTDAINPVISPDGATVAFSSCAILEDDISGDAKLYLYDVGSGEITYATANEREVPDHGIYACFWSTDSRTLTTRDYREEGGGIRTFRTLTLLPKP